MHCTLAGYNCPEHSQLVPCMNVVLRCGSRITYEMGASSSIGSSFMVHEPFITILIHVPCA